MNAAGIARGGAVHLAGLLVCVALVGACGSAASSATQAGARHSAARPAASAPGASRSPASPSAAGAARVPDGDWATFDVNAQRTGVAPASGIRASNIHSVGVRVVALDGTVDSAPIQLHAVSVGGRTRDVVFVTTTYGRTLAIDPATGKRLWQYTPSDIGRFQGSAQVTTATPVADPDRRFIYAASPDGIIHKLAVASGRELRAGGWPVRVTFDAAREKIASALNLDGPYLVVVTGGYYGDAPVYQGHVALIDRANGRIYRVFNALCSNRASLIDPPRSCPHSDAAIWARAGAVVQPGSGRMLVATGNGDFNGRTDWGDSVLELSRNARPLHNWTPLDQRQLDAGDGDLGSTAPAPVTVGRRHLAVQGGKDRQLHVLDLDRLDGTIRPAGPGLGGALSSIPGPGSAEVLTAPAVWSSGARRYVFVADDGGTAAYIVHGGSRPRLTKVWGRSTPGTSPVLVGGLLYVYDEIDGALDVYAPKSGARVASLRAATGHWNSPIVVGGRIVLPVGSYHAQSGRGRLYIWHLRGR